MSKILASSSSELSIHLDSAREFLPGEVITDYVSRTSPWVDTETSISIILHGSCSTEFFCRDFSSCSSSLELLGRNRIELLIGALHIPRPYPDQRRWRFRIDIPGHPDPRFLRSHSLGKASYLPLPYANLHALPPSFDFHSTTDGSCPGFAVVEATITNSHASKFSIARLPLQIRCESSPFPIADFDTRLNCRCPYTVTSPHLAPGRESEKLSTKQQIAKSLGISGAPRLTFCLETSVASVLQKGSPYHIPFEIRAIPRWDNTSKCIVNVPQCIRIKSITLAIKSTSSTIAFATSAVGAATVVREVHFKRTTVLADYSMPASTNKRNVVGHQSQETSLGYAIPYSNPLTLPIGDNANAINLGQVLDLRLQDDKLHFDDVPTFITYNIKRSYQLEWKMALEVYGVILRVDGKHPVLIME